MSLSKTSTFLSIQYLRAFASLIVVYEHVFLNRTAAAWSAGSELGNWGVDIFFVISGFVMWTSTAHKTISPTEFFSRRLLRIFPLYWFALTLWIGSRFLVPDRLGNADVTPFTVAMSYLLLPHYHLVFEGEIRPLLTPGWTLQIELFFYVLFSLVLLLPRKADRVGALISALVGLSLVGIVFKPHQAALATYTSSLLVEFGAGVLLGVAVPYIVSLKVRTGAFAIVAGLLLLLIAFQTSQITGVTRPLLLGVPAVLVVGGMLVLEKWFAEKPSRMLLLLGNASYSLYLIHPLAIAVIAVIWAKLQLPSGSDPRALLFVGVSLCAAEFAAMLCYRLVEYPIIRFARPKMRTPPLTPLPLQEA